ncbi:hypothetical protein NVR52_19405 [Enterobacter roggenkampii]|uniref:hypothetical protein n=1 Tax=Enterobacter roggenkampii TaxID=1812935 RepID=UPI00254AFE6B|nr:hypothetical protein [Enterobacter roggenkampii]MDK9943637.1 hypothetical protein [Enterobacter roggenkampii]MDK9948180.1 hypothetical protein [Enterobacter roggenkampii]
MSNLPLDKILSILSSIGTFVSAIAAIYAIWLTIIQKRLTYKPEIIITDTNISMKTSNYNGFDDDIIQTPKNKIMRTKFTNIGLGAAISIKYWWSFDYQKSLKKYHSLFIDTLRYKDESITTEFIENCIFIHNKNTTSIHTIKEYSEIDFSLPYSVDKESTEILIDELPITIMLNNFYLLMKSRDNPVQSINGPILSIEYLDIEGRKNLTKWETKLKMRRGELSIDNMQADFSLEFTPIPRGWTARGLKKIREVSTGIKIKINQSKYR